MRLVQKLGLSSKSALTAASTLMASVAGTSGLRAEEMTLAGCAFTSTFTEDFHDFHVTPWASTGKSWTAHTPWAGDFGDAAFTDPRPGFPFSVSDGRLHIEAKKDEAGKWRSGLLSSADGRTVGFSQLYGYFEMSAKLPQGEGLWPAFWLATNMHKTSKEPKVEIDVMEHYGRAPGEFHSVVHVWNQPPVANFGEGHITKVAAGSLYSDFHQYGVDVEPQDLVFYLDRKEVWRTRTPPEHKKPLTVLLNLALGAGWPIDKAPNPSVMDVAYVKVFERGSKPCG